MLRRTQIPTRQLVLCLLLGFFSAVIFILPTRIKFVGQLLENLEWASYDTRMRIRPQTALDTRIRLVGVTDIDYYLQGDAIASRHAYAFALQVLRNLNVHYVMVDILFEQSKPADTLIALRMDEIPTFLAYKFLTRFPPIDEIEKEYGVDRTSLKQEFETLADEERIRERIETLINTVEDLMVESQELHREAKLEEKAQVDRLIKKNELVLSHACEALLRLNYSIDFPAEYMSSRKNAEPFEGLTVILPTGQLMIHAHGLGFINIEKGVEDVVRRTPLVFSYGGKLYPNIDLILLCDYYGVDPQRISVTFGKYIEFKPTRNHTGVKRIPIDRHGNFRINFREGETFLERGTTLQQLFHWERYHNRESSGLDPDKFENAIILLGENNVGGTDTQPIPLQPGFPMVGIHANVIDNILKDDYLRLTPPILATLIILVLGLGMGLLFGWVDYHSATGISLGILILYILLSIVFFNYSNLVLPVVKPLGTIIFAYLLLIFYTIVIAERERRQVRRVFLKTVSPEIGEEILKQYNDETFKGSKQTVTVMFADIRGFTTWTETLAPERTVELLNTFYDFLSQLIFSHGGQINKFMGDEVMALFNAPIQRLDAEIQAILTAVEIQQQSRRLNETRILQEFGQPMEIGIGINTGEVVVGTVGGRQTRIEYTALGDHVNIASRLQGVAQPQQILIGSQTYQRSIETGSQLFEEKRIRFFKHAGISLKGKKTVVDVYEVLYDDREPLPIRSK